MDYVTIASTGDSTDFGDLTAARFGAAAAADKTRAIWAGGATPGKLNTIDYVTIASTGNATDFGDRTVTAQFSSGSTDNHGGVQG